MALKETLRLDLGEFVKNLKRATQLSEDAGGKAGKGFGVGFQGGSKPKGKPKLPIPSPAESKKRGKKSGDKFAEGFKSSGIKDMFVGSLLAQGFTKIVQAGGEAIKTFIEFDKQIKNIGTLGVANYEEYTDKITELSKRVPDNVTNLAEAVYQAHSAGITGTKDEMIAFTEVAAKTAVAGLSDTKSAVNGLTSVVNAYGLNASDATSVSDTFFAGIKLGKTTFEEMNSSLANFVPTTAALGVGFDQATAAIADMTAQGTPTALASTQINAGLLSVLKGNASMVKGLKASGLTLKDLQAKLKLPVEQGGGLVNVFRDIKKASDASGIALIKMTGRAEGMKIIETLAGTQDKYNKSLETYRKVQEEIAGGASEGAFKVAAKGIGVQIKILKNNMQAMFNNVFQTILPAVNQVVTKLVALFSNTKIQSAITGIATAFGGIIAIVVEDLMPVFIDLFAVFAKVGKAVAKMARVIMPIVAKVVKFIVNGIVGIIDVIEPFIPLIAMVGLAWVALNAVFAASPIGAIITGVIALALVIANLADALHESKEEKLENIEAEIRMNDEAKKTNKALQKQHEDIIKVNTELQELKKNNDKAAVSEKEQKKQLEELNKKYPDVIDATKSFEENLNLVAQEAESSTKQLEKLVEKFGDLDKKAQEFQLGRLKTKTEIAAQGIVDAMSDAYTVLEKGVQAWAFEAEAKAHANFDNFMKKLTDAKNIKALDTYARQFGQKIQALKDKGWISATESEAIINQINQTAAARREYLAAETASKKVIDKSTGGLDDNTKATFKNYKALRDRGTALVDIQKQLKLTEAQMATYNKQFNKKPVAGGSGSGTKSKEHAFTKALKELREEITQTTQTMALLDVNNKEGGEQYAKLKEKLEGLKETEKEYKDALSAVNDETKKRIDTTKALKDEMVKQLIAGGLTNEMIDEYIAKVQEEQEKTKAQTEAEEELNNQLLQRLKLMGAIKGETGGPIPDEPKKKEADPDQYMVTFAKLLGTDELKDSVKLTEILVDSARKKDLQKEKKSIDAKKAALDQALKDEEISQEEHSEKMQEIRGRETDVNKQLYDVWYNVVETGNRLLANTFNSLADASDAATDKALQNLLDISTKTNEVTGEMTTDWGEMWDNLGALASPVITSMVASMGQALAEGGNWGKAMLMSLVDTVTTAINLYSAQQLAGALASPESIATFGVMGFAKWAAWTTAVNALLAVARAQIGAEEGGIVGDPGFSGVISARDTIPIMAHAGERFITKELAERNPVIDHVMRGGSEEGFFRSMYGSEIASQNITKGMRERPGGRNNEMDKLIAANKEPHHVRVNSAVEVGGTFRAKSGDLEMIITERKKKRIRNFG